MCGSGFGRDEVAVSHEVKKNKNNNNKKNNDGIDSQELGFPSFVSFSLF